MEEEHNFKKNHPQININGKPPSEKQLSPTFGGGVSKKEVN
jgi:hypothetical protein